MSTMKPHEIVAELDKYVIGQEKAKRMVAVAIRNRWRRQQLTEELRASIENELLSTQQAEALDAAFEAWKDAAGIEYTEAGEAYRPAASESLDEAADIGD